MKSFLLLLIGLTISILSFSQDQEYLLKTEIDKGLQLIENCHLKLAKRHFRKLSKEFPEELEPKYLLTVSKYLASDPWSNSASKVIDSYDQLLEKFPNESKIYFRRALAKLQILDYHNAREDLETCKQISASIPEVYFFLGLIDLRLGYHKGVNILLYTSMKSFEVFIELADSNHILYEPAITYRALAQQKNNIGGLTMEEHNLLSKVKGIVPLHKPNILFNLDTMEQVLCDDLYLEYGILVNHSSTTDSIQHSYSELIEAEKLSDLIKIDSVVSFKIVKSTIRYNQKSDTPDVALRVINNPGNKFSESTLDFIKDIKVGESLVFEQITTTKGTVPNFAYRLTFNY